MNYVNIPHSEHSVGSLWMVFVSVLRRKWLCPDRSPLKSLFWRARVLNQCWTRTNQSPSARVRWSTAGLWPLRTGTNRFTLIWTHTQSGLIALRCVCQLTDGRHGARGHWGRRGGGWGGWEALQSRAGRVVWAEQQQTQHTDVRWALSSLLH